MAAAVVVLTLCAVVPWRWFAPPTTAFVQQARRDLGTEKVTYRWVALEEIAPPLALCVVAAEDQKFPTHHGFDYESIRAATREARTRPRGASTISQQVAKNLFLWPGRSILRKGLEAYLTVFIETFWPKRRILEVYLNVAEFGRGVFGAEAASRHFFGKPARQLSLGESALLTAVLPNPKRMSVGQPSEYVRQRAEEIEAAARQLGPRHLAGLHP